MEEWIHSYINLLSQNLKGKAKELKLQHFPDSFFKYRDLSKNTFDCLSRNTIWMSRADKLNDPFESALYFNDKEFSRKFFRKENFSEQFHINFNCEISPEEIVEIINDIDPELKFQQICEKKKIDRDFSSAKIKRQSFFNDFMERNRRKIRLCSFSTRNDSLLMWSHYADSHKGISLEYNFKNNDEACNYIEPVYYTDQILDVTNFIENSDNRLPLKIAAISKAQDWQYEKEWRLTFPSNDYSLDNGHYVVASPVAIYLGVRFNESTDNNKNELFKIATDLNIPIYKMNIHNSKFQVVLGE